MYGVNPMLVGNLLDVEFEGQSSIVCHDMERLAEAALQPAPARRSAAGAVKVARTWTDAEVLTPTCRIRPGSVKVDQVVDGGRKC